MLFSVVDYWTWPGDRYGLVNSWWNQHRDHPPGPFPENLIPSAIAIFVLADGEPSAFMVGYMPLEAGVGILDMVVTRPGMSLAMARGSVLFGEAAILRALNCHDYGLCNAFARPNAAKFLVRHGWQDHGIKHHLVKPTSCHSQVQLDWFSPE